VLSYLTCASLTEDRYGVVQKDIPKILEAMVLLLSAIEEYNAEVVAQAKAPSSTMSAKEQVALEVLAAEIQKSREVLSYLEDGELVDYCVTSALCKIFFWWFQA
jgi:nucleoporin NDC1